MDTYLAHSAGADTPAQSYTDHVSAVVENACQFAMDADVFNTQGSGSLTKMVRNASEYHDLGKLEPQNQSVLHEGDPNKKLPVNHVDAGAAYCFQNGLASGLTVYSHHHGLPDIPAEENREETAFRDKRREVRDYVNSNLENWINIHHTLRPQSQIHAETVTSGDECVFHRIALSCLADADHSDTAKVYGQSADLDAYPELLPAERLIRLDSYVKNLGSDAQKTDRDLLRSQMFEACRNADVASSVVSCSSPVGTGKTTAVMAHLLQQALKINSRHIFVVLPYTNIITQSVQVYRKALTLPGEDPESVVAELHHKADYEAEQTRYLSALWRAPIIVTTAVAFFETMAANKPAALRRLHELPGSVIFVDEAHAALPVHLLPLAWRWMQIFADEWHCHWVLASGSLVQFWNIPEISAEKRVVPELVSEQLRNQLAQFESRRISYQRIPQPVSRWELVDMIAEQPGPRLVIVNTVKNAAVLADDIKKRFGRECVEHLSTALSAADRSAVIECVKKRLDTEGDCNWTLVATSCVEAGVDFSFKTGFREMSSLLSLLQASGRINRNGKEESAIMLSFVFQDDLMLTKNPGVEQAAAVLHRYFDRDIPICPELSTDAIERELGEYGSEKADLLISEENMEFETVAKKFQVIDSDTVLAIVDHNVAEQVRNGGANWRLLQKHAVSIRRNKIVQYRLKEIARDVFEWTLPYDSFLGYMAGILIEQQAKGEFLCH